MELARQIVKQYPPEVEAPSWERAIEQLDPDRQPPVRAWISTFPFDLQQKSMNGFGWHWLETSVKEVAALSDAMGAERSHHRSSVSIA
jgi:hypothetical protein